MTDRAREHPYEQHYRRRRRLVSEQLSHPLFESFYDRLAGRLLDLSPSPATAEPLRVLEVAVGEGFLAAALLRVGKRRGRVLDYVGSDLTAAAVSLAATVAPGGRFVRADAEDIQTVFAGDRFDLVVAKNLLHHLQEPSRFLRQAGGLLAAGGRVVVVEALRGSAQALLCSLVAAREERHFLLGGRRRNVRAFRDAGLRTTHAERFSFLPYELLLTMRSGVFRRTFRSANRRWLDRVDRADRALSKRWPALASYEIVLAEPRRPPAQT